MRLQNKVAIVTGGGSGIGRATAIMFAKEGASVVVADYVEQTGKETAQLIENAGGHAAFIKTDVSQAGDIERMVSLCIERFKRVDIIVNDAGIVRSAPLDKMQESDWDAVIDTNLKSVFLSMKRVIPEMLKNKKGKIVNIASIAGLTGFSGIAAYGASKGGIVTLTKDAALEYAPQGINVNCIAPGIIETAMTKDMLNDPATQQGMKAQTPYIRLGVPNDIAYAALYLASDESDFVCGEVLVVDGGWMTK